MITLKQTEEDVKEIKRRIEDQPEGETKEALKGVLDTFQLLKEAVEQYDALSKEERESLPESLREFYGDKAA